MLTDREAEEIERARRAKAGGPIVLKWVDQLLADRRDRIRQLEHLRKRLRQAFRYLDGLVGEAQGPALPSSHDKPVCPSCGKGYVQASGVSPQGILYVHADRRECRG